MRDSKEHIMISYLNESRKTFFPSRPAACGLSSVRIPAGVVFYDPARSTPVLVAFLEANVNLFTTCFGDPYFIALFFDLSCFTGCFRFLLDLCCFVISLFFCSSCCLARSAGLLGFDDPLRRSVEYINRRCPLVCE